MALNFSHRPIFPEENLVSPMRIANGYLVEGMHEKKNGDGFAKTWHSNRDIEDCIAYGRDRGGDRCGSSQDPATVDILDLLPTDPFGMDISSTFTAITGWLEHLEVDYEDYGRDEIGIDNGNYKLFAGLNFIWSNAMRFQEFSGSMEFNGKCELESGPGGGARDEELGEESCHGSFISACNVDDILSFENENLDNVCPANETQEASGICTDGESGAPHSALSFALAHLGLHDLLVVGRVCKSLHSTVQSDPLLWRHIHIDQPLNEKITDDVLLQLTDRAQGALQCLSLVECPRITDEGLKYVLERNPRLTKLSVPGCTKMSIEGILNSLKALKSTGARGVKHLRIGGLYGVTQDHYEELRCLLGTDESNTQNVHKPRYYRRGNFYLSCDDDRAIDIEMCQRCQNLRLVYDCPAEGCKGNRHASQLCRACTLCIQRCVQCGRCINDSEYEETFCLEYLCSDCWKQVSKCDDRQDRNNDPSEPSTHNESSGRCLHG